MILLLVCSFNLTFYNDFYRTHTYILYVDVRLFGWYKPRMHRRKRCILTLVVDGKQHYRVERRKLSNRLQRSNVYSAPVSKSRESRPSEIIINNLPYLFSAGFATKESK